MKIVWTQEAENTFMQNIAFLETEWNERVIANFIDKTEEALHIISLHPHIFPLANKKKGVRKCSVVKQVSLYYKVIGNAIYLVTFWNNYQTPSKLKL